MRLLGAAALAAVVSVGVASCVSPARAAMPVVREASPPSLVLKTLVIGKADRMTLKEFAKATHRTPLQVENWYSAAGRISCKGMFPAGGEVTLKGNILVTAAHIFVSDTKCNEIARSKDCVFTTKKKMAWCGSRD